MKMEEKHQRQFQRKRRSSRIMAWTLCFALLMPLVNVSFVKAANPPQDNLCIHHPEHTEDCGYAAPEEEGLCTHKHDESCGYTPPEEDNTCTHEHDDACGYAAPEEESACTHEHDENCGYEAPEEGSSCTHEHDDSCGYREASDEIPCDMDCAETYDEGNIIHQSGCAYTPAAEGADCTHEHDDACGYEAPGEGSVCTHEHDGNCGYIAPEEGNGCTHEHDDTCGYIEETEENSCNYVCGLCVINWKWIEEDELLVWSEEEKLWGLGVPGTDEEHPLTREELAEFLPKSVEAETAAGSQTVDLLWDLDKFPESTFEGEFTLDASLSGEYVLMEDAPALEVLVVLGGGELYVDKAKYLNQWSFIGRDDSKLETNVISVVIADLDSASREEILQWLKDSILPNKVRGWTAVDDKSDVLGKVGFTFDEDQSERKFETTADGLVEYKDGYQWGASRLSGTLKILKMNSLMDRHILFRPKYRSSYRVMILIIFM